MDWSIILEQLAGVFWEAFSIIFLGLAGYAATWLVAWIKEHIKARYAIMAVELAETFWDVAGGDDKFDKACAWLAAKLKRYKINVTQEDVEELVQTAWYDAIEKWENKTMDSD